ncbi:hypothetical protein T02_15159 [Trichinella nativa]|uniref:Uncharacterized protein n=1 Tax=Trichinella nativa TaxID=6335 RepID=A0A0V1KKY7_9BILA|nr:hypothetical protein T02_15159 [Trichinella nativa]
MKFRINYIKDKKCFENVHTVNISFILQNERFTLFKRKIGIYNVSNSQCIRKPICSIFAKTQNEFRHQSCGFMRNFLHSDQFD